MRWAKTRSFLRACGWGEFVAGLERWARSTKQVSKRPHLSHVEEMQRTQKWKAMYLRLLVICWFSAKVFQPRRSLECKQITNKILLANSMYLVWKLIKTADVSTVAVSWLGNQQNVQATQLGCWAGKKKRGSGDSYDPTCLGESGWHPFFEADHGR